MKRINEKEKRIAVNNSAPHKIRFKNADNSGFAENIVNTVREPLVILDQDLKVVAANPLGSCIVSIEGKFQKVNKVFTKMIGYEEDELKDFTFSDITHPDDLSIGLSQLQKMLRGESESATFEKRYIRKDTQIIWVYVSISLVRNANHQPQYFITQFIDITERKLADDKLQKSETRFKQISEGTEEWIWEVDVNGVFTYMNPYVKKLLGYYPDELIGIKHFYDFFEPEHKEELIQGALVAFERKESIRNFINCNIHKDGRRIILSTSGFPILDSENIFIGYRGINVDITDRQKAEDELKISEMKFRNIVEGTKAILFSTNRRGIFTYLNEAACKKLEMENQELLGQFYLKFIHPEGRAKIHSIFTEQIKNPAPNKSIDVQIITKLGKEGWLNILVNPIYVEGKVVGLSSVALDITERKHTEYALRESEAELISAMKIAKLSTWEYNFVLDRFTFADQSFSLFNTTAEHEGGNTMSSEHFAQKYIYPDDRVIIEKEIRKALETPDPAYTSQIEYRVINTTSELGYFSANIRIEKDADNRTIKAHGINQDITERKLAELKLKESEAKLTDAMMVAKLSTWEYNFALDQFTFNDHFYSLFHTTAESEGGYTMSSGHFAQKFIYPDDRVLFEKEIRKALETPDPAYTSQKEYRVINTTGEKGFFATNIRIEKDADNRTITARGVNQDITERKLMEETLVRINKAVESSSDAVCMSDSQGHHFYHNKAFTENFGYTLEELEAAGGGQTIYADKNIAHEVFDVTIKGGAWNGEVEMLSKDNRKFIVWLRANAITDVDGVIVGLVGMNTDITQQKQAEVEINEKNKQLVKLNAEKDKFFSIISHDLRSPFNGFLNLTELMADSTEKFSPEEFVEYSKSLNESARILYKLLDNLLEWAQIHKGSVSFIPKEINLFNIISQNIEIINQRALQKGITIISEVPDTEKVCADEKMINTVLRNLLSNAVKFTRKDGKIIIKSKPLDDNTIEVSIEDNGVGIPEKDVKRLFKIEEKVSSKGTEGEPSTGLGLLLCKEFVELNKGEISVESERGKGSTFSFTLPLNKKE